jgi:hypothetical protein
MTQDECLASPHHFTHLGVCYAGSSATIQLSNPRNPQPATFSVPEPSTSALFALAFVVGALSLRSKHAEARDPTLKAKNEEARREGPPGFSVQ